MYAEKLLVRRQNVGDLLAVVESLGHQRNEGKSHKNHVECKIILLYFLCIQPSSAISVGHHFCRGMVHATILGSARILFYKHVECKVILLYFLCLRLSLEIFVGRHLCRGMVHAIILGSAHIPFFNTIFFAKFAYQAK